MSTFNGASAVAAPEVRSVREAAPSPGAARDACVDSLAAPELEALAARADAACRGTFGDSVFVRGLIEASNRCVRDCAYCGIRRSNGKARRYSLSDDEILGAARRAFAAGVRTFVLQGAEDPAFSGGRLAALAAKLKEATGGDAAITLSFGTMTRAGYAALKRSGADRYLLRFETSDAALHEALRGETLERRLRALSDLRELGFEVGSGFMTGLPGSTRATLDGDVELCAKERFDMVGIGPFIPHPETPLALARGSSLELAIEACARVRLALPGANMPATTAAGSLAPDGRERMLAAGANVLMPNVGPTEFKKDYELYPGKICLDEDGLKCVGCLSARVRTIGKRLDFSRGDSPSASGRGARRFDGGEG
jgi:biotin synthase